MHREVISIFRNMQNSTLVLVCFCGWRFAEIGEARQLGLRHKNIKFSGSALSVQNVSYCQCSQIISVDWFIYLFIYLLNLSIHNPRQSSLNLSSRHHSYFGMQKAHSCRTEPRWKMSKVISLTKAANDSYTTVIKFQAFDYHLLSKLYNFSHLWFIDGFVQFLYQWK